MATRHYETMYIVDAETSDEELEPILEKYKKIVTDGGGEVATAGKWDRGRRQLAYPINNKREGLYLLMEFTSDGAVPKEMDRLMRIDDAIMRFLVVRQNDKEE